MTKIKQSDFDGDTITKVEEPKKLTREQKLEAFNKENATAIAAARQSCCVCSPTRAEILLIDQSDGIEPID
jgi:hypothetical protein